jgi:hypothetical protein
LSKESLAQQSHKNKNWINHEGEIWVLSKCGLDKSNPYNESSPYDNNKKK